MKKIFTLSLLLTALIMTMSRPCYAHKVRIFAWEEGADIVTESKFSGGRAARSATVSVIDTATGRNLVSGTTDEKGLFRFPIPEKGGPDLEIIVDGGDGHKNSWKYTLETQPQAVSASAPSGQQQQLPAPPDLTRSPPQPAASLPVADSDQLAAMIEEVMERKLGPIRRSLAENSERGPGLQDILGGIGYIFGLAGVAAYMRFNKKNKE